MGITKIKGIMMKRSLQVIVVFAYSIFVNNLSAAADTKKMVSIKGMGKDLSVLDVSIAYDDTTTIKEIKEYIYSEKKIPVVHQVLYKIEWTKSPFMIAYMKRYIELKDDQTCASCGIQEQTILGLCLK
jgi:hypothetical protein